MMKRFRQIISGILTLCLLLSMLPVPGYAAETETVVEDSDVTVSGGNAFGDMLSENIQAEYSQSQEATSGYGITDLEVAGNTATVTYYALEKANLVVGIYTEDGVQMITSGRTVVDPEETKATVRIEGTMPEYFAVSAFLLDTYDYSPLCDARHTLRYTKDFQDLLNSTVDDYDPDLVMQLGDTKDTNFAVYAEGTIIIPTAEAGINTVTRADSENYIYVIENANEDFLYLQEGDIISYSYGDEEMLLVKVASTEIDGTTVTIYGDELEIEDVFSHIKVEATADTEDVVVQEGDPGDLRYLGKSYASARPAYGDTQLPGYVQLPSLDFELELDEDGNVKTVGTLSLQFQFYVDYYSVGGKDEIYVSMVMDTTFEIALAFEIELPEHTLPKLEFPIYKVINIGIKPVVKCEAAVITDFTYRSIMDVSYVEDQGISIQKDGYVLDCHPPRTKGEIKVNIGAAPYVTIIDDAVLEVSIPITVQFKITIEVQGYSFDVPKKDKEGNPLYKHACSLCVASVLSAELTIQVQLKPMDCKKLTIKTELATWPLSPPKEYHINASGIHDGLCEKKAYFKKFQTQDSREGAVKGVEIWVDGKKLGTTNEEGLLKDYIAAGERTLKVVFPNGETYVENTTVSTWGGYLITEGEGFYRSTLLSDLKNLANKVVNQVLDNIMHRVDGLVTAVETLYNSIKATGIASRRYGNVGYTLLDTGVMYFYLRVDPSYGGEPEDFDFEYKDRVTEIIIEEGITGIGEYAFEGYTNLKKVTIPSTVKVIRQNAFRNCTSLTNIKLPDNITEIESGAFEDCTSLKTIRLPANLETIPLWGFRGCTSLETVEIPDGVTEIGSSAFRNCRELRKITIPETCQEIGDGAFYGCEVLKRLEIPAAVDVIPYGMCDQCTRLEEVVIRGASEIGEYAFSGCRRLKEADLPEGLTSIGYRAFFWCESLEAVTLPTTLVSMGEEAFANSRISEAVLAEGFASLGRSAFDCCKNLQRAVIPSTLTEIPGNAFYECTSLADVEIAEGVTVIGESAFSGCPANNLRIPGTVTSVGEYALRGSGIMEAVLPESLVSMGRCAFYNCKDLQKIVIPSTLQQVPMYAFRGCENVTSLVIAEGPTSIEADAFSPLAIDSLVLPDSITDIDSWAFSNCEKLQSVKLPAKLESLGEYAFLNCQKLTDIVLPETLTEIADYLFAGCYDLSEITLPSGLTRIGEKAFSSTDIREICIPAKVTSIGDRAFGYSYYLNRVVFLGDAPAFGVNVFAECDEAVVLYPQGNETWTEEVLASTGVAQWHPYILDENGDVVIVDEVPDQPATEPTEEGGEEPEEEPATDPTEESGEDPTEETAADSTEGSEEQTLEDAAEETETTEPEETEETVPLLMSILSSFALKAHAAEVETLPAETEQTVPAPTEEQTLWEIVEETLPEPTEPVMEMIPETEPDLPEETDSRESSQWMIPVELNAGAPSANAIFGGEYTVEEGATYTMVTATFVGLKPNENYVLLDVLSTTTSDPLAASNVLGIFQGTSDSNGTLIFEYAQKYISEDSKVMACGPSTRDLNEAVITFPDMMVSGTRKTVLPEVWYNDSLLVENQDYVVLGEVSYQEEGNYVCFIRGINQYSGLVECGYTVGPNVLPTILLSGPEVLHFGESIEIEMAFSSEPLPGTNVTWSLAEGDEDYVQLCDYGTGVTLVSLDGSQERMITVFAEAPRDAHTGRLQVWLGHDYVIDPEVPATCTQPGKTEGKSCAVCGEIFSVATSLEPLGHSEVTDPAVLPTCTQPGLTEGKRCSVCEEVLIPQEVIRANGHRFERCDDRYVCEACGEELAVRIAQEYVALDLHMLRQAQLSVEILSAGLPETVSWEIEGEKDVLEVDQNGAVTALNVGTAWVVVTADYGELVIKDRCRVDVTEFAQIRNVQLNTTKVTSELFRNEFATFEVLLQLPQNNVFTESAMTASRASAMATAELGNGGVAIQEARFADAEMDRLFKLQVLDDRQVQIVPDLENAVKDSKNVKSKYTGKVEVLVQNEWRTTEESLTLTVKKTMPKLKATVAAFNSFYEGQTQEIVVTGGTVREIREDTEKTAAIPAWLTLEDGILTLNENAPARSVSGKAYIEVLTEEWRIPAALTLSVKNAYKAPTLKLSASTVTLNKAVESRVEVGVTANQAQYTIADPTIRITGEKETGELTAAYADGILTVETTDKTPDKATYKLYFGTAGCKEVALTVKIVSAVPSVTFKASGNMDLSFPEQTATVTPAFKNYGGGFEIEEMTAKNAKKEEVDFLRVMKDGRKILVAGDADAPAGSYTLTLKLNLDDGSSVENTVKVSVKRTAVKLKLSASKVTMNKDLEDQASVAVSCTTMGYAFDLEKAIVTYDDSKLKVDRANGDLVVTLTDGAEYGKTYPVSVSAGYEGAPAVKLNVAVAKQNAVVKSTIKATGSLDVIRDGTAITVKPTYTNVTTVGLENKAVLKLYSSADKYQDVIAEVTAENGVFVIDDSVITDHSLKYKAQLETRVYEDKTPVKSNMISLSVRMGTAKLTARTSDTTLFARDKNDRATVWFEAADAALNNVAKVEIKDTMQAAMFEIIDYGSGVYAIGFKDGNVDPSLVGKTVTVTLNVFIDGNLTAKANATAKVKLTVVK